MRQFCALRCAPDHGIPLAMLQVMPEQLTCPCCASTRLVILSVQCRNCGVVIAEDPRELLDEDLHVRPKLDRRRQPRP
jgi:hypothetical protein